MDRQLALIRKAKAVCEVQGYWGDYTGHCAYLVPFKTTRQGSLVVRFRWESSSASALDITGTFTDVGQAVSRAMRCKHARNVTQLEG